MEAKARIKINKLLEKGGWRFFDDDDGPANVVLEANVKVKKQDIDALGEDFEKTANGYVDYLLLDHKGFPCAVLEAKREELNPLNGKEQARRYANSQNVRFVILSNGNIHYFWDIEHGNPAIITDLPTPSSLTQYEDYKPDPNALAGETIQNDYIAVTQLPGYAADPRWKDPEQKPDFIKQNGLKFLRHYQLTAVKALQTSVSMGNNRFLFEMATGTGKTLTAAAVIKLFLRTANARRVLFLVDRLELENQAYKNFVRYLKNDYQCVIYKERRVDWRKAEIIVSTVQSLLFDSKYRRLFSPTDFDFIISDEAHRSINGNARALFEYFVGYKLGLTATPKNYLKNLPEDINQRDPRAWERRQLLDTYKTFGCESGKPTYQYSLVDGVKDSYLVNPIVADARTDITTELLSQQGFSVMVENEDGELVDKIYFQKDFEKKFFSDKTNRIFCKTFLENARRDPLSGEIGKTIIFCVSQNHASKITQILNEFAHKVFPGKYNSDFAVQVTSVIPDAQQMTMSFANNNLTGHSRFIDGYLTSKTRVCVTVGMMTTGYDCEDIVNLCLMRPIFSPQNFIQIKGRGTRTFTFAHATREHGETREITKDKADFKLFDFFANCEYFEEKFNYDEVLELPQIGAECKPEGDGGLTRPGEYENIEPDPIKTYVESPVGAKGMKIDRKFYENFEQKIKEDETVRACYEKGDVQGAEKYIISNIFDKPEEYFTLEKLRQSVRLDRRLWLREIIVKAFGDIERFKTKNELLDEEFDQFISVAKPESERLFTLKNFFNAYITDGEIRDVIESKQFNRLATNPKVSLDDLQTLGDWRKIIPEYVKDYVSLNTFI